MVRNDHLFFVMNDMVVSFYCQSTHAMQFLFTITIIPVAVWIQSNPTDEQQIRAIRAQSNQAIAAQDSIRIADYWTEDFVVITSRNLEIQGREENRKSFAKEFKTRKNVRYVRTPETIRIFESWNMASETGTWTGEWQEPDGQVKLDGTYYAKWHKIRGGWKIRAEVFTPLACSGSNFCNVMPNVE